MNRKLNTTGFTIAELLTVVAVLAILMGILMPALNQVRKMAKETKQKAQLQSIDIAINLYKNDFGDYPESSGSPLISRDYCGSQKLAEALFGYDLLGFHQDSIFDVDGKDSAGNDLYPGDPNNRNLSKRKGPYLNMDTPTTFTLNQLKLSSTYPRNDRYFICDMYNFVKVQVGKKFVNAGTPILYFKANPASTIFVSSDQMNSIYNFYDNVTLNSLISTEEGVGFYTFSGTSDEFYEFVMDPMKSTSSRDWPVRPDSFILISAGYDGLYGTADDICNFEPNIQ